MQNHLYDLAPVNRKDVRYLYKLFTQWVELYSEKLCSFDNFKRGSKNFRAIVHENQVVGMIYCYFKENKLLKLEFIILDSDFRGKQIGTAVLKDLLTICDINSYSVLLFVNKVNQQAIKFYKKFEFEDKPILNRSYAKLKKQPQTINAEVQKHYENSSIAEYVEEQKIRFKEEARIARAKNIQRI